MDVTIRIMQAEDETEVIDMMRTFYATAAVDTNGSEEIFLNDFQNCIDHSPFLEGYVIMLDHRICGYTMIAKSFSTEFGKPCIWIEDIYLQAYARGMGIAGQTLDFLCQQYPGSVFRLEVERENHAAMGLYRKKGFHDMPYLEMIRR